MTNNNKQDDLIEPIYISTGCNRCPKALDWGGNQKQLIYAHSNSIALLNDREPFYIKCTFNKHTDKVNCVKWISSNGFLEKSLFKLNEFISASKDKSVILWQGNDYKYEPAQILDGHTSNVCVLDAMYFSEKKQDQESIATYIASASVDSTVRIWSRHSDSSLANSKFELEQVVTSKGNGFALALKFYLLPLSNLPLLLIGFENHKIEMYVRLHNETENKDKFYCLHSLIGHEDWIRDIDVCQISQDKLLIASGSQDNYIRLWKLDSSVLSKKEDINTKLIIEEDSDMSLTNQKNENNKNEEESDEDEDDRGLHQKKAEILEEELKLKSSLFTIHSKKLNNYVQYSINLESVLYGHEDWIYTVKFHPKMSYGQPLILISASMDKTLVVWKYNEENAVWIDETRTGDIGGTTLGFYGATFEPNGNYIVAHGYQGALHLWKRNLESKMESLTPAIINGGHFDLVEDICWEPEQEFLLSVSKDQTTRFHSYWKNKDKTTWHELGRPQIHGYDMQCVAFIERFKFVSGADEKLLRIFESPKIFLQNFYKLCLNESLARLIEDCSSMPQGASVPALGLSNKAVYNEERRDTEPNDKRLSLADELYKEVYFNIIDLTKPPSEEHLLQNTLWPEMQKLYGHGYELFAVAVDPRTKIIASSCKASKPDHAHIILWQEQISNNQKLYKQIGVLKGHELTVVQMKFSNNSKYLLSVSRDRSWKLYRRQFETNNNLNMQTPSFELIRSISTKNIYHTRIIWSCDWSHDDKYFITTSRDKRVCIWPGSSETQDESVDIDAKPISFKNTAYLELDESITACSLGPDLASDNKSYLIALGFESGKIEFYLWNVDNGFTKYSSIQDRFSHHLTVKRLSFRKKFENLNDNKKQFCLASCSDDCSVRLFTVKA